jgi:hypothetical protein
MISYFVSLRQSSESADKTPEVILTIALFADFAIQPDKLKFCLNLRDIPEQRSGLLANCSL